MECGGVVGRGYWPAPGRDHTGELYNPVGPEAAQLGRHRHHDPRRSDPDHIIACGDLAEEIGRDLADLVTRAAVTISPGPTNGDCDASSMIRLTSQMSTLDTPKHPSNQ